VGPVGAGRGRAVTLLYPVPEILPDHRARFIQIVHTCHAMAARGVGVHLLTGVRRGCDGEGLLRAYGLSPVPFLRIVPMPVLRGRISWHAPFHAALLPRAMREPRGVIFARYLKLARFLLRWRRIHRLPVIFEAHEILHKTTEKPGNAPALKAMEAHVYREADAVIAITGALAEEIHGLFGRKVDGVIPDGVGSDFLDVKRSGNGSYLLYTGQFYPWKGVEVFVRTLSLLPNERAVIVGGAGEALDRMRRLAQETGVAGRVEFAGTVPHAEVKKFLEGARVAILPNLAGGVSRFTSPLKLFEYMAAGVPVVASDLPALREVLRDGENAILVPPGDPAALAAGIRRALDDEALSIRISAKARSEAAGYTWESRAKRIREVLDRLPGQQRPKDA